MEDYDYYYFDCNNTYCNNSNNTWNYSATPREQPEGVYMISYMGNGIGVFAVLLNIVFTLCMAQIPNPKCASNRFIKNLSICDIFGTFTFLLTQNWPKGPFAQITSEYEATHLWIHGSPYIFRSVPWMFFTAYLLTINCLTISQYLASCKPHIYASFHRYKTVTVALVLVWCIASLQVLGPIIILACLTSYPVQLAFYHLVFVAKAEMVSWLIVYTLSTLCSILLNVLVYFELRRHRKTSRETNSSFRDRSIGANTRAKNKAFITSICLCVASVSRIPLILVSMLLITFVEDYFGYNVMCWVLAVNVMLLYLVFVIDPIIYVVRMRHVRTVLKSALRKTLNCLKNTKDPSSPAGDNLRRSNGIQADIGLDSLGLLQKPTQSRVMRTVGLGDNRAPLSNSS